MTNAAAQTWGAIIVAAFALDVLCAVAKPRCASNAPSPNSSVPTSFVAHSSWPLARRLTVWCGLPDVSAQDDACRRIYHVGLFARRADDGLISVDVHGHIVCGKTLNAKGSGTRKAAWKI